MKKKQEKSKLYMYTSQKHQLSLKPRHKDDIHQVFNSRRAAIKTQGFSMTKDNTPPEAKANHKLSLKPRQIKSSAKLNKRRLLPLKYRTQGSINLA
jgi:hypothetical protein